MKRPAFDGVTLLVNVARGRGIVTNPNRPFEAARVDLQGCAGVAALEVTRLKRMLMEGGVLGSAAEGVYGSGPGARMGMKLRRGSLGSLISKPISVDILLPVRTRSSSMCVPSSSVTQHVTITASAPPAPMTPQAPPPPLPPPTHRSNTFCARRTGSAASASFAFVFMSLRVFTLLLALSVVSSAAEPPTAADVIVIGAGLSGLFAAHEIQSYANLSVIVRSTLIIVLIISASHDDAHSGSRSARPTRRSHTHRMRPRLFTFEPKRVSKVLRPRCQRAMAMA
jgi:hypothetical protein